MFNSTLSHLTMPTTTDSMIIVATALFFLFFAAFVYKEKGSDERESAHISRAGRVSYLAGVLILTLAIITQTLMHDIDPWLVAALLGMVVTKLASRLYSHFWM